MRYATWIHQWLVDEEKRGNTWQHPIFHHSGFETMNIMNCQHIKSDTQRMNSYSKDTLHYYYFWPIWVALVTATGAMRLPSYAWPCSTRPAKVTALWHRCAVTHGCSSSWRAAFGSSWEDSRELCMWTCGSMRLGGTKAQLDETEKSGESNCSVGM